MANWMSDSSIHLPELEMRTCASRSGTCLMQTMIFMLASGAKAPILSMGCTARLKSCPFKASGAL